MPHPTRPLIGVNADYTPAAKSITAHLRLPIGYVDAVVAAGGLPVVLPPLAKDVDPDALLDRLDGVLLSGGLDLDPRRHGLPTHSAVQLMAERRDDSDRCLIRHVLERRTAGAGRRPRHAADQRRPRRYAVFAPAGGAAAGHAAPRRRRGAAPSSGAGRAEHAAGRDLRRRRNPRQQRPPSGRASAGAGPARLRQGAGRRHRSDRSGRSQLVLRRRAVAPRIGHGVGAGRAAVRVLRPGVRAAGAAVAAGGVRQRSV